MATKSFLITAPVGARGLVGAPMAFAEQRGFVVQRIEEIAWRERGLEAPDRLIDAHALIIAIIAPGWSSGSRSCCAQTGKWRAGREGWDRLALLRAIQRRARVLPLRLRGAGPLEMSKVVPRLRAAPDARWADLGKLTVTFPPQVKSS
jgi:hypothetical protein